MAFKPRDRGLEGAPKPPPVKKPPFAFGPKKGPLSSMFGKRS